MLFQLDIEYLYVWVFACAKLHLGIAKVSLKSQVWKPHTHSGIFTMFVLFYLIPDPQYEGWQNSETGAEQGPDTARNETKSTHSHLPKPPPRCTSSVTLTAILKPSLNRRTGGRCTLNEVVLGSTRGTLHCRSDNIYTRDNIWRAINQLVTITVPERLLYHLTLSKLIKMSLVFKVVL